MSKKHLGILSLLLVGAFYGISGVMAKYLSNWLSPYQVVEYRFAVALLLSLLLLFFTKQSLKFKKVDHKTLAIFAVSFPISAVFFTLSVFNTTVLLAVFSFYIANLVSSFVLGRLQFNEKITKNKKIALVLVIIALLFFTNPLEGFTLEIGFLYGLISGLIQTIASAFQKIVSQSTNRIGLLIAQTLTGLIIASIMVVSTGGSLLAPVPVTALLVTQVFGALFLAISYLFLVGFKYVNINTGSILVSSELIFGPLFALLFLSEIPTGPTLIGGVFTIVAVLFANKD